MFSSDLDVGDDKSKSKGVLSIKKKNSFKKWFD